MKRKFLSTDLMFLSALCLLTASVLISGCSQGGGDGVSSANAAPPFSTPTDLSGVTQNWDKTLPSVSRFTVLADFGGAAVRDNNTGLVWEQAPELTTRFWSSATGTCVQKTVGGTVGWRLPSEIELRSVQDPSLPPPYVPASVFTGVQSDFYWSATTHAEFPTNAWAVNFGIDFNVSFGGKTTTEHAWCVRGPMNADAY